MRFGRDARVSTRRGQRENRVLGIVESVNDVVRGARMVRVLLIDLERDRAGPRLEAITLLLRIDEPEQRKGIEGRAVEIVGITTIDLLHRGRVRGVARAFVAVTVQELDSVQIRTLA